MSHSLEMVAASARRPMTEDCPYTLTPQFTSSGTESMFLFFTGAIDLAYVGITPYLLGHSYGLPVRIVAIAQEYGPSHGIVLRDPSTSLTKPLIKLGTVLGSDAHRIAASWAQEQTTEVSIVNLTPPDQLKAFEFGFIDGVAVWEPQLTLAEHLGGERVFTTDDTKVAGFNLVCASDTAIEEDAALIDRFLEAHMEAVSVMSGSAIEGHVDYLSSVFDHRIESDDYLKLIQHGYRWPSVAFRSPPAEDHPLVRSITETARFLRGAGLIRHADLPASECFPAHWPAKPPKHHSLAVGYSDSLMCASYHLGQGLGLFERSGFAIDSDERRLIERIASLDRTFQDELATVEGVLRSDPELAVMKIGRINELLWTEVYRTTHGAGPPRQISKTMAILEEEGLAPLPILSSAGWVRSIRNVATHHGGISRSQARSAFEHLIDILEWHEANRDSLTKRETTCPECEKPLDAGWKACPFCGADQSPNCRQCGESVLREWKICPHCGADVRSRRGSAST